MKILHSDTPNFNFDEDKLEIVEKGSGIEKIMQIEGLKVKIGFAEFWKNAEDRYDCIVLLQGFQSFRTFPQPDGKDYLQIRYWGRYSQKFIDLCSIRDQNDLDVYNKKYPK